MKKNLYTAPLAEQLEVVVENRFLTGTTLAPASTVETADYHDNEAW